MRGKLRPFSEMADELCGIGRRRSFMIASPESLEKALIARFGRVTRSQGHNGMEFIVDCPVCGRHKMSVNSVSGIYKCWRGCTSGVIGKLLESRLDMVEAAPAVEERKAAEYYPPGELLGLRTLPDENPAIVYLRSRKFDVNEMADTFGLTYCRIGRQFANGMFNTANTLSIPVVMGGVNVGWQNRLLYDPDKVDESKYGMMGFLFEDGKWRKPPKYFTMPGMDKRKILWNYDNARESDIVVVTEGVFDAARVGRCGVASFGKSVSDDQIRMLQSNWKCIVLLLDPDAKKDSDNLKLRFSVTTPVVQVDLKGFKDAGDADRLTVWDQILDAMYRDGVDPGKFKIVV